MAGLSNFLRNRNAPVGRVEYRPVQRPEIEPALRLMLSTGGSPATDEQILDFLALAVERKIDVNGTWIAIAGDRIAWTLLPVISPGRTMLLFTPSQLPRGPTPTIVVRQLSDEICSHYAARGVQLAQLLIDPADKPVIDLYQEIGFTSLAELLYLQRSVKLHNSPPPPLEAMTIASYSAENHAQFTGTIARSYQGSLDCPALNNVRNMDDVLAGHRAAGEFDPSLWFVVRRNDEPIAVLLLTRTFHGDAMELVYLGLVPETRGIGLGDWLMKFAIERAARDGRASLSLAVDAANKPALDLYFRHGLQRIGSRLALIRELHPTPTDSPLPPLSAH